ncbi:type II toxin-antitoxin system HigB family toxin [Morganella morganii]|nr:type II toxin-antitoxin system HigB family toxin [Morganella morganii]
MRLLGKSRLSALDCSDKDIYVWISAWIAELSNANWKDEKSMLDAFPRAMLSEGAFYAFPVCGKDSLLIKIAVYFNRNTAVITEVVYK